MPKHVDFEEKKLEIMKNALQVFIEKGYHNTNMVDVARRCGMARTTMYEYFANKDEIFSFALKHVFRLLNINLEHIINNEKLTAIEKIKAVIRHVGEKYCSGMDVVIILVELWLLVKRKDVPPVQEATISYNLKHGFKQIIEEGIAKGEIKNEIEPEALAGILYSLTESFIVQISLHQEENFYDHLEGLNILLNGLQPPCNKCKRSELNMSD